MKNKIVALLPESLLIGSVLFYWISTANLLNPVAIVLILVLGLQMIFKNRVVGLAIPIVLILASLFMVLALISELNEFPNFNADAQKMLLVGSAWLTATLFVSGLMLFKYATLQPKRVKQ
jgi:maltodextrin utilization protein YvdJ